MSDKQKKSSAIKEAVLSLIISAIHHEEISSMNEHEVEKLLKDNYDKILDAHERVLPVLIRLLG